jgi:hypothetical protein
MDTTKPKAYCANCHAAKFMIWKVEEFNDVGSDARAARGIAVDRNAGIAYAVRCDYFKTLVFFPADLQHCDAFIEMGPAPPPGEHGGPNTPGMKRRRKPPGPRIRLPVRDPDD